VLRNQRTIATAVRRALDAQRDQLADAQRTRRGIGLAQRIARRRLVDDLAVRERRKIGGGRRHRQMRPATVLPHAGKSRAHDDACARRQAVELARRRDRPLPQQALEQRQVLEPRCRIASDVGRVIAARLELAHLFLDLEREVEREQEELASFDRPALVGGERREVVADRNDRDGLRHPVHRHHVGELHVVRAFTHVPDDGVELPLQETVGIRQREQQRLQVRALGRSLGVVVGHGALVGESRSRANA
jgi:hypothetical protein